MIAMEANMSWSDIGQWLRDGWFYVKGPNYPGLRPARLSEPVGSDHGGSCLSVTDIHDNTEAIPYNAISERVFPHWPNIGAVNVSDYKIAVWMERRQLKQWRRTYNARQLNLSVPRSHALETSTLTAATMRQLSAHDPAVVKDVFAPIYPEIDQVNRLFRLQWGSVAITPRIIITNTSPRFIYYRGKLAGAIRGGYFLATNEQLARRVTKVLGEGELDL